MTIVNLSKRTTHFTFMALSILLMTACGTIGNRDQAPTLFTDFSQSAEYALGKSEVLAEPAKTEWKLVSIQALTRESQYVIADSRIEALGTKNLTNQQKNHVYLLSAENQYAQNNLETTIELINSIDEAVISKEANLHYLKLKVQVYLRQKETQQTVDTLLLLTPLLTNKQEKQYYNDMLLTQLSMLPTDVLNQKTEKDTSTASLSGQEMFVQGWYSLASVYERYQLRTNQLIQGIEAWKKIYPDHPVIDLMPTQLLNLSEAKPYAPNKIAILLPLTGRFKKPAQALQYGISNAFYNQTALQNQQYSDETSEGNGDNNKNDSEIVITGQFKTTPPNLQFIDTNKMTMQEIADQLREQNVNFVVGPLLKPNVEAFLPLVADIPVLALNNFPVDPSSGETPSTSAIHYAFPLSPEDEAEQAAELMFQNKHKMPVVFAPQSDFGKRAANAFEARWKALSEESDSPTAEPSSHFYTQDVNYKTFLGKALKIDVSNYRLTQMKKMSPGQLKALAKNRQNADSIYIIGKRRNVIFFKSFMSIVVNPHAKEIPLYASSRSHEMDLTNTQDRELKGLTFSDVSFLVNEDGPVNKKIQSIWPKQRYETLRLFALGYDSYNLIERLKQLQVIDGYQYQGLVGQLMLDSNNTINSRLAWATYEDNGTLVEVTTPTPSK